MEQAIQVFAAISFLVIGLSHLSQPKAWVAFFQALAARGTPGVFAEGFLVLNFGTLIVAFHNVWHGPGLVLTLIGWAQVLKGVGRFVAPQVGLRVMQRSVVAAVPGITAVASTRTACWTREPHRWRIRSPG